jgi:hypothetical protein
MSANVITKRFFYSEVYPSLDSGTQANKKSPFY